MSDIKIWIPTKTQTEAMTAQLRTYAAKEIKAQMNDPRHIDEATGFEYFLDAHGHLCMRTKKPLTKDTIMDLAVKAGVGQYAHVLAHVGTDNVLVPYDDAMACMMMLDVMCDDRADGDDSIALGQNGISFERLYDRIAGMIYPVDAKVVKMSKKKRTELGIDGPVTQRRDGWDHKGMKDWRTEFDKETAELMEENKEDDD